MRHLLSTKRYSRNAVKNGVLHCDMRTAYPDADGKYKGILSWEKQQEKSLDEM
jgi:hypothetical protein